MCKNESANLVDGLHGALFPGFLNPQFEVSKYSEKSGLYIMMYPTWV
jgi:hypothetical protein